MKKILLLGFTVFTLLATHVAFARQVVFVASLQGTNVVPPSSSTASGVAFLIVDDESRVLNYVVVTTGFGAAPNAVTTAYIYLGGPKVNGASQQQLIIEANTGKGTGTFQLSAGEVADFFRQEHYIQLNTGQLPNGAIRGQLSLNPKGTLYTVELKGSGEVPPNNSKATAEALVFVDSATGTLAYAIRANGFGSSPNNVVAAHIHLGKAGASGSPFITTPVDSTGNGTGLVLLSNNQRTGLAGSEAYLNLHTTEFPSGAIRGQLQVDPGPSTEYEYKRNDTSFSKEFRVELSNSVINGEARRTGQLIDLVDLALSQGAPQTAVGRLFDASEFPGGPLKVTIVTRPITITTDTEFTAIPGIITSAAAVPGGISQPDFRNLYFQDYLVTFDEVGVNQLAAVPTLFGPVVVSGSQVGGPANSPSVGVTAFNLSFEILTPGQVLVGVHFRTIKTLRAGGVDGGDLTAADINIVVPVTVTGPGPYPPYAGGENLHGAGLLETQLALTAIIDKALADYADDTTVVESPKTRRN